MRRFFLFFFVHSLPTEVSTANGPHFLTHPYELRTACSFLYQSPEPVHGGQRKEVRTNDARARPRNIQAEQGQGTLAQVLRSKSGKCNALQEV